jgi:hypothetical protein
MNVSFWSFLYISFVFVLLPYALIFFIIFYCVLDAFVDLIPRLRKSNAYCVSLKIQWRINIQSLQCTWQEEQLIRLKDLFYLQRDMCRMLGVEEKLF